MAEIDLRPDHLAVVKVILNAEIPDRDVWAFGSRAKWTARDASDLDLAIRGDRPLPLSKLARLRRAFEESYLPFEVDLVDWHSLAEDFQSVILAQKVVLQRGRDVLAGRKEDDSWRSVPLSECADFLSGSTPSRANPEYWKGEIPWVTAKDMKQLRLYDTEDHLAPQAMAEGVRLVPAGTILVLVRGMTLHNDLPICITRRKMAFNQDVRALRPKPGVDADFLAYALLANKKALLSLVDAASHGTGRIHSGALASFPIALPLLAEQCAIAEVLGALDDKIDLIHRMNQTLETMARAIFKSWFVDFESGVAAADCEIVDIYEITTVAYGAPFASELFNESGSGLPLIRIRDLMTQVPTEPLLSRIVANEQESRTLDAIRDALLPKLLSGEIRVKQAEKIIGEVA